MVTKEKRLEIASDQLAALVSNCSLVRYGSEIGEFRFNLHDDKEVLVMEAIRLADKLISRINNT